MDGQQAGARRYRKRPVVVEAVQITEDNAVAVADWVSDHGVRCDQFPERLLIETLEGEMSAPLAWWVVRGTEGEFWPVKPSAFAATYEPAGDEPGPDPLAERIGRALDDSIDSCARCKVCDRQVGAVVAVVGPELDALRARVAEYENGISWNTSCTSCAKVLDSSYRDHARAEKAEQAITAVRGYALDPATAPDVRDALQALLAAGGWEVIP